MKIITKITQTLASQLYLAWQVFEVWLKLFVECCTECQKAGQLSFQRDDPGERKLLEADHLSYSMASILDNLSLLFLVHGKVSK